MSIHFPCLICQFVYDGKYLWNIHGNSLTEDRHMLCTPCLIKYCSRNTICPLRCGDPFNPVQLNPGYKRLVTRSNREFIEKFPEDTSIPNESTIKNQKLWLELVTNVEQFITVDTAPVVYGWGRFRHLTYFMHTLKSDSVSKNIEKILKLKSQEFSEDLDIKVGIKRKLHEIEYTPSNEQQEIQIDIGQILQHIHNQEE